MAYNNRVIISLTFNDISENKSPIYKCMGGWQCLYLAVETLYLNHRFNLCYIIIKNRSVNTYDTGNNTYCEPVQLQTKSCYYSPCYNKVIH